MRTFAIASIAAFALAGCDQVDLPFLKKSNAQLIAGVWACASDQGRGVAGLTLHFARDGKGLLNVKGELKNTREDDDIPISADIGVDVDVNFDYGLTGSTLAMNPTGGKINRITFDSETIDLIKLGGPDAHRALQKKMFEDARMGDSNIETLDAQQLVLKPKSGGMVSCRR